ncbi:MAG: fumarylacetoacetate hydrolase family protein [Pseudolabrys sp.]|jgi:2-keto-4-pentenoate hydratase/2-oxohepta-3-ene-1,7-dioic acid hydratase in catechol pathway|nr:fumarylacetoacetate hydrolase family protein [Pseudolabrys sp.]
MRLASFSHGGRASYGIVNGDRLVDLGKLIGAQYPDLKALLTAGPALLDKVRGQAPTIPVSEVKFLPVIPNPDKIFCAGLNYRSHVEETGRTESEKPVIFLRLAASQVGHGQPMIRPTVSTQFDYEGELAVVIGKRGRHIPRDKALDYIAGYSCYNDGSLRDWQRHTSQWTPGKNFPATGAFGPWLVTADEIPDPTKLSLATRLNGQTVQSATVDLLIFSIPELIEYVSAWSELAPGDVIATGTPGGVGFKRTPPLLMKAGDTVDVEISTVGTLSNPIEDERR